MVEVYFGKGERRVKIQNIIPNFLALYEATGGFEVIDLENFVNTHPEVFNKYFPIHCPKTEERLQEAIEKYPAKIGDIRLISERLPGIIEEIDKGYMTTFGHDLDIQYTVFVGTFGSNAFVTREIKGDIYFLAEKLSPKIYHLKVITAHEIGHVTHFSFAARQGMDWKSVDWIHGLTTLFTEGAATYLSKKIVPELNESVYFTYNDEGAAWVTCFEENNVQVKQRFLEDVLTGWDMAKEKEWFRLSGGSYFGYNRLGYLLGSEYVEYLVDRIGEEKALAFWNGNDVKEDILNWLTK